MLLHFQKIIKHIFMRIKNFLFVFFFLPSICIFADSELDKLLDEARKLKEEGEEDDVVDTYKEILKKYDLTLLDKAILLDIRRVLAYYYFSKEKYHEAQEYFTFLVRDRSIKGDELQDVIYKFCLSIYFQLPSRAEVDLSKCYELRNAVRTFSRYVKNKKILNHMEKMCKEALSLVEEQKCLLAEYYFNEGYYSQALYLCDKYLMHIREMVYTKRLIVLKLKTLTVLADFRSYNLFLKFFEVVKSQYKSIYLSSIKELDDLYSVFDKAWERRRGKVEK